MLIREPSNFAEQTCVMTKSNGYDLTDYPYIVDIVKCRFDLARTRGPLDICVARFVTKDANHTCVCEKETLPRRRRQVEIQAFKASDQGPGSSLRCRIAGEKLAQKECFCSQTPATNHMLGYVIIMIILSNNTNSNKSNTTVNSSNTDDNTDDKSIPGWAAGCCSPHPTSWANSWAPNLIITIWLILYYYTIVLN